MKNKEYKTDAEEDIFLSTHMILWKASISGRLKPFICLQSINILHPTGYVMHQQSNIQQLYVLPTLYLCVLYLSENKQRFVPLTA